jgi:hypothetical protein
MAGDYGPFSGDLIVSCNKLLANDNAAANARAKDNSEHYMGTNGGAVDCLRKGKAICVVFEPDWAPQSLGKIAD